MRRFAGPRQWPPGTPPEAMVVTYVRAHHLADHDPREWVLRPQAAWTLTPGVTFGFGRAPDGVDLAQPLIEEDMRADTKIPRLAGKLSFEQGLWRLSNHASKDATLCVSAPGAQVRVTNSSLTYGVRTRRLTVTVHARSPATGETVEHRFTLLSPRIHDDVPAIRQAGTTESVAGPDWPRAHRRFLAAWAYPELIGLWPRGFSRGLQARLLLHQSVAGGAAADPNERILAGLRKKVGAALGVSLKGEAGTPALLDYLVTRRGYLAQTLAELHAEFDAEHPAPPPG